MSEVFMDDSQYALLMSSFSGEEQAEMGYEAPEGEETEAEDTEEVVDAQGEGGDNEDMPWLYEDEDEGEASPEDDSEDEDVSEDEAPEDVEEGEEGEGGYDVDYDTIITLPNGDDLSIEDLYKGYKSGSEFDQEVTDFNTQREEYKEKFTKVDDMLNLAVLEAERVVDDYKDFDWEKIGNEDPKAFMDNKKFLEQYQVRLGELKEAQALKEDLKAKEDLAAREVAVKSCIKTLTDKIPEWSDSLYQDLMKHGVEQGISEDLIVNLVDPGAFIVLYNSMMREQGKAKAVAKIRKSVKSPSKVSKQKEGRVGVKKNATTAMKNAAKNFKHNPSDPSASFEYMKQFGILD